MALLCDGSSLTPEKISENLKKNKWILDIIHNEFCIEPLSNLILQEKDWSLIYEPGQRKLLVVFKDLALSTIRDLRSQHIGMLEDVMRKVRKKIVADWQELGLTSEPMNIDFYFHYWPSVYQLHAHVKLTSARPADRCHMFQHVIRNLKAKSMWYRDAVILYSPSRSAKATTRSSIKGNRNI